MIIRRKYDELIEEETDECNRAAYHYLCKDVPHRKQFNEKIKRVCINRKRNCLEKKVSDKLAVCSALCSVLKGPKLLKREAHCNGGNECKDGREDVPQSGNLGENIEKRYLRKRCRAAADNKTDRKST